MRPLDGIAQLGRSFLHRALKFLSLEALGERFASEPVEP